MRAALIFALSAQAWAATHTYVIAIGNNAPPAGAPGLPLLHYADDDAADFYTLTRPAAKLAFLLTVLDSDSQRRFERLAEETRPPSLKELDNAVSAVRAAIEIDLRAGDDPVLLFFFSGHGTRGGATEAPALTLVDGGLTQQVLYDQVLAKLPAHYIHLFVDACHAEAIVRPRDAEAQVVAVSPSDVRRYAERATLDRFPRVGAVVATSSAAQAHEWDLYQRGVFSHEILSGLRGAADVNGDGNIEYSELAAFLASANRDVPDERARLNVVVRPPSLNHRAVIFDLHALRGFAHLVGRPAELGPLYVEDEHGNRLADVNAEPSYEAYLTVPADEPLYVHAGNREALVRLGPDSAVRFESLVMAAPRQSPRGAVDAALERGLFSTSFGPRYYVGWVDHEERSQESGMQSVSLDGRGELVTHIEHTAFLQAPSVRLRRTGLALLGTSAALAVAGAVFAGLTAQARGDFDSARYERPAAEASDRYNGFLAGALTTFAVAAIATGVGVWALQRAKRLPNLRAAGAAWSF